MSARDTQIAKLISEFKMEIVDPLEIPNNAHYEVDDDTPLLLETTGRQIIKKAGYFHFVLSGKQFTAPATIVQQLRKVQVEHADNTNNLVVRGVTYSDVDRQFTNAEEINDEMYHWGHQVYMVPHNDEDHSEYNVLIHVSRYDDSGWHTHNYVAAVEIDERIQITRLRNRPGVPV